MNNLKDNINDLEFKELSARFRKDNFFKSIRNELEKFNKTISDNDLNLIYMGVSKITPCKIKVIDKTKKLKPFYIGELELYKRGNLTKSSTYLMPIIGDFNYEDKHNKTIKVLPDLINNDLVCFKVVNNYREINGYHFNSFIDEILYIIC